MPSKNNPNHYKATKAPNLSGNIKSETWSRLKPLAKTPTKRAGDNRALVGKTLQERRQLTVRQVDRCIITMVPGWCVNKLF